MVSETTPDDDTSYNIFDNGEIDSYLKPSLGLVLSHPLGGPLGGPKRSRTVRSR